AVVQGHAVAVDAEGRVVPGLVVAVVFAQYAPGDAGGVVLGGLRRCVGEGARHVAAKAGVGGVQQLAADFRGGEAHGAGGELFPEGAVALGHVADDFRGLDEVLGDVLVVEAVFIAGAAQLFLELALLLLLGGEDAGQQGAQGKARQQAGGGNQQGSGIHGDFLRCGVVLCVSETVFREVYVIWRHFQRRCCCRGGGAPTIAGKFGQVGWSDGGEQRWARSDCGPRWPAGGGLAGRRGVRAGGLCRRHLPPPSAPRRDHGQQGGGHPGAGLRRAGDSGGAGPLSRHRSERGRPRRRARRGGRSRRRGGLDGRPPSRGQTGAGGVFLWRGGGGERCPAAGGSGPSGVGGAPGGALRIQRAADLSLSLDPGDGGAGRGG